MNVTRTIILIISVSMIAIAIYFTVNLFYIDLSNINSTNYTVVSNGL